MEEETNSLTALQLTVSVDFSKLFKYHFNEHIIYSSYAKYQYCGQCFEVPFEFVNNGKEIWIHSVKPISPHKGTDLKN